MARITVEDCLKKIDSQYDLVLLAKERTAQLNAGTPSLVPQDDDKNTVISLREIGEGKVSIKTLEDSAITKLRKMQPEPSDLEDLEDGEEDDFDKIYKGEISKSGAAVLPSKRVRRMPEKIATNPKIEDGKKENDVDKSTQETANDELSPETTEPTENNNQ
jgi:DNA-directed RNA polymerase subunit omega